MEHNELKQIIETILFVSDGPIPMDRIAALFEGLATVEEVTAALDDLCADFDERPLALIEVAEGWRIQTRPEHADWLTKFFKMEKGRMLGRAALEALAIVAYRQPITRAEIDEIRGVDSGAALRGLIDKNLVKSMGRRKAPGKPMMWGTTQRFLEYFGLAKLSDLPTMEEFAEELAAAIPESPQESLNLGSDDDEPVTAPPAMDDEDSSGDEPVVEDFGDDMDDSEPAMDDEDSSGDEPVVEDFGDDMDDSELKEVQSGQED